MSRPSISRHGFSLVELLVATATTTLLIVILASMLQVMGGTTRSTQGRMDAEREARAAFEMLERDLAATVRNDGQWIRMLADPDPPTNGGSPRWLMFLSSPLDHDRDTAGDVCVLSYRLGHEPLPGEDNPFPALHRLVVTADDTFEKALGLNNLDLNFFTENDALETASRSLETWLAAGVIDIQVRGWSDGVPVDLARPGRRHRESTLEALEVTLEVLSKRGQQAFANLTPEELRKSHAYRFTRRIPIPVSSP